MALLPDGYLTTAGSQIVDGGRRPVRLCGVGWNEIGAGPWQDFGQNLRGMVSAGFNVVRVSWVNASRDADLARIDKVVAAAAACGMKVILDNHANESGTPQQKNGLWYDVGGASDGTDGEGVRGTTTDAKFLADWVVVVKHYAGNATVIGFDLRNEPLAYPGMCTWGDDDPAHDLRAMYQRVGDAIHAVNAGPLIICEGPQNYNVQCPWGDLRGVQTKPVVLKQAGKVVYSVHDYPKYIAGFTPDSGAAKISLMNTCWGYVVRMNLAPVWIGEMGASFDGKYGGEDIAGSRAWAQTLLDYMNGELGAAGGPMFASDQQGIGGNWWCWGCLSGQQLSGTQNPDGSFRAAQQMWWSQMAMRPQDTTGTPTLAESADGTTILKPADPAIIGSDGTQWTLTAGAQVAVNGVADTSTANVVRMEYRWHRVSQTNQAGGAFSKQFAGDFWRQDVTAPAPTPAPVPAPSGGVTPGKWVASTFKGMPYNVLFPFGYSATGTRKYPLLVFLHQYKDEGEQPAQPDHWFNTVAFRTKYPCIVFAPVCNINGSSSTPTWNWGGVDDKIDARTDQPRDLVMQVLRKMLAGYPIDPTRVYLTGNSMGGLGTWGLLCAPAYEPVFAAALPVAGACYYHVSDAAAVAQRLKAKPIWAVHGRDDTQVSNGFDRAFAAAIKANGGSARYTELPMGHDVWDTVYPDPAYWDALFGQAQAPVPVRPESADLTIITKPTDPAIISAANEAWTLTVGGQAAVNGAVDYSTASVVKLVYAGHLVYQQNAAGNWWRKARAADAWQTTTSPLPTPAPTPAPVVTHATVQTDLDTLRAMVPMTALPAPAQTQAAALFAKIRANVGTLTP